MALCIETLPHSCGSSDALQVFGEEDGSVTGYCFSCDTYVSHPYGEEGVPVNRKLKRKTSEQIQEELAEISALRTVSLPTRKLTQEALAYFDVKVGLSEQDGSTPIFAYFPLYFKGKVSGYKVRLLEPKKNWSVGEVKQTDLFGWKQAIQTGARRLFITEGEFDAVALWQALKNKAKDTPYEAFDPAVVSLTHGTGKVKGDLTTSLHMIKSNFKEVVFVFDMDEAGYEAVRKAVDIIPYGKTVTLPANDPNDALMKGYERALCDAVLFKSTVPKSTRLIWGRSLIAEAREEAVMGFSYPWEGLTKLTRGIRRGETVYLGSGVKMGKTTMVDTLAAHMMQEHGMKVFCAQPEDVVKRTFRRVVGKVAKRIFHDPDIPFDYNAYDKAAPLVGEHLCLLDLYQDLLWNDLRVDITTAVQDGCEVILIDPITNITNGIEAGQANTILQEFAQQLAYMTKDLNLMTFLFCHLKAPESGLPHERGGKIYSNQFAGSRAMMRSCNTMLGLEGNKDPDLDEDERNMRRLVLLEDREFGATGYIPLWFDKNTGCYHEMKG